MGEVCIDNAHKPTVSVFRTHILQNGRGGEHRNGHPTRTSKPMLAEDKFGLTVFERTGNDNKCAMSFKDETF